MISHRDYFHRFKPNETVVNTIDLTCGCDQYVYLIETSNEKYIMKIPKTEPIKILNEVFALNALKDRGVPIPLLCYYDETVLIESYLEGNHFNPEKESIALYEDLGRYVKKIHSVKLKGFGPVNTKGEGDLAAEKDYLPYCMNPNDPSFKANRHMKDLDIPPIVDKNIHLLDSERSVLVHGDLHSPNILTYKGNISGIIDYADMIAGAPEYDLAFYLIHVSNLAEWNSFLKGYGSDFNEKKMHFYVFILCTWLLSCEEITKEKEKCSHFKTSLTYLQ